MKNVILLFNIFLFSLVSGQRMCGTSQKMEEFYQKNPEVRSYAKELRAFLVNPNNLKKTNRSSNIVTIPVVVHVLYKNSTQNISDAQIQSQISVLNQDFRKLNSDFSSVVPAAFQPFGADLEIAFCMATKDPNGVATNGIVRKSVPTTFDFENEYYESTGDLAWDPNKYLNIWIGAFDNPDLLGFAYLPEGVAGQPFDGLAIGYQYFGTIGTVNSPYNGGRTATHEIGHYLGLLHPWGDDGSACGTPANDDGVADTPATNRWYFDCPTYPDNIYTCTSTPDGAMFMNFMDYVNDSCMAFFTNGQKTITRNVLSGPRASLLNSNGCQTLSLTEIEKIEAIKLFPNPSTQFISVSSPMIAVDEVEVFDSSGKLVLAKSNLKIQEKIDIKRLSLGIYYIRIYSKGNLLKSDKFIKQ